MLNHPFIDGNKRTAFAATDVYLRLNGTVLHVADDEAYQFIVGSIERGEFDRERIDAWLREHITAH